MSAEEGFLARWSRRKRAAARGASAPQEPPASAATQTPPNDQVGMPPIASRPEADLPALPPIASIGAGSDVQAFLAPEVPAELTRAALRRAWSTDPAIRDFVGLSENSWDFAAPDGVPGFGAIGVDEVQKLLAQATGERRSPEASTAEPNPSPGAEAPAPAAPRASTPPSADDAATQHAETGAKGPKTPES